MNWLTKLVSTISILIFGSSSLTPSAIKNNDYQAFQKEIVAANIEVSHTQYFGYRDEIEFEVKNGSNVPTKVIFNTQKSPLIQVSALQKIIKLANIKGKTPVLVDLSSNHPYATLKNN